MEDFGVVYFPARTLLHHADPYNQADVLREYEAEGGDSLWKSPLDQGIITHYQYPPPSFCITAPFALMPWNVAQFLWAGLAAGGMILAAFLLWSLCADYAPVTAGVLIGFLLANSQVLLVLGNAAGPAVSLCIIAVWSFLRGKYPLLGVLCLAGSLMLKPHDSVLVWLFFLLAGSVYRKRALQVLGLIAVSAAPIVLYLFRLSSSWMRELRFNIAGLSVHGGPADPGPASAVSHGLGMMVNLQAAISTFWDDPRVYNPVAYLVCGLLLAALAVLVLRSRISTQSAWLAIGSVVASHLSPSLRRKVDSAFSAGLRHASGAGQAPRPSRAMGDGDRVCIYGRPRVVFSDRLYRRSGRDRYLAWRQVYLCRTDRPCAICNPSSGCLLSLRFCPSGARRTHGAMKPIRLKWGEGSLMVLRVGTERYFPQERANTRKLQLPCSYQLQSAHFNPSRRTDL
jgi:hypothetical protein